jgi:hypothetical protein
MAPAFARPGDDTTNMTLTVGGGMLMMLVMLTGNMVVMAYRG